MNNKINVSETFLSIQGEGSTTGCIAVFLRLQGCDFGCKFCDTTKTWKKGTLYTYHQLVDTWKDNGSWKALVDDKVTLVITGGNPLIRQDELIRLFEYLEDVENLHIEYTELEAQGNILPKKELNDFISQYNVSPKLANSGIPITKRIVPSVMKWLVSTTDWDSDTTTIFKFVVATEDDVKEAIEDFIKPFKIDNEFVYLMPMATTREQLHALQPQVVEWCKKYGYNFSPRLQVEIWDRTVGV